MTGAGVGTTVERRGTDGDMTVEKLVEAVRAGRADEVPALLEPLDAAARKAALARLKALRSEVRAWDWKRWNEASRIRRALHVAGAGCHTGAAATASWLGGRDLLGWRTDDAGPVLSVLRDRDPAWLADVAGRLAARRAVAESCYDLVHGLVVRSGRPAPATDGYVIGWTRKITGDRLLERLREDPQTPVLVAHAISMADAPDAFTWPLVPTAVTWPAAVAALVADGVLDRASVVDLAVSRLLRGGRPRDLRFPLELLRLLAPDVAEHRERVADWIGMTADAPSPVAGYAQEVLSGLAAQGALPTAALAEMTAGVLFRPEKKLVKAQLVLVGKVLARDAGAAGELLPVVAEGAFGHEDTALQERALKLVGRHLEAVDGAVRRELAGAASLLSPVHREAATAVFGDVPDGEEFPYEEILPPVPEPQPLAAPPATVEELMEDLLALRRSEGPMELERALDGLVRHAHRDRAAVAEAVAEAFAKAFWQESQYVAREGFDYFAHTPHGIHVVLAALVDQVRKSRIEEGRRQPLPSTSCVHAAMDAVRDARLWEAADLIGTGALPFLLATPTRHTGGIDPLVLVERLRAYAEAGVEPAPADLAQALLRVRRDDPSAARAADEAAALGGTAGERLAGWLRAEAPVAASVRLHERGSARSEGRWWLVDRILVAFEERPVVREFPSAFRWLGGGLLPNARRCYHSGWAPAHWATQLPADREVLAAALLSSVANAVDGDTVRGVTEPLTLLSEAEGRGGRAVSLVLAFGLGCVDADDRLRAVDALLVLAARGELDAPGLGEEVAWLVTEGSMKPNRLADAVRTAAATGAYGTVWAVLAAALPGLLGAQKPVRGLGEVLAVAADCAERCGVTGEVPGLADVARAKGSSQLVTQARRLLNALHRTTDQNKTQTV
ncbi:DUF6493 family protein [Streptomyces gulbargensis]|uniref:DUF6493 family protein n=2 Tax=Streptomyces gulbargensis TaxID=364901 RepID=A0ABP7MNR7_9ACTN